MVSLKEFKDKRGKEVADRYNVDLLVASLPENIYYYTNFYSISQKILSTAQSYLVYNPHSKEKAIISSAADVPTIIENCDYDYVYSVGNFKFHIPDSNDDFSNILSKLIEKRYNTPFDALKDAIIKMAPSSKRVALDDSRMPFMIYKQLKDEFLNIDFISGVSLFQEIRLVKHKDEIELIKESANIAEKGLDAMIRSIKPGISEYDIGVAYAKEIAFHGANPYFCVVTVDKRAAFADTLNQGFQKIKKGSVIRVDFGCIYMNYRSDLSRTIIVGSNKKAENYYKYILEGEEKAINSIKPGVTAEQIFNIAVNEVKKGIPHYERHHCGHGIGLEVYDKPSIAPGVKTTLEPGMTFCIETPYYEVNWGGVQVEDTIVVTNTGSSYLSLSSRELIRIEI